MILAATGLLIVLVAPQGVATHLAPNSALGLDSAIGGGNGNEATAFGSWVGSGYFNSATDENSVVAGGKRNVAGDGNPSTITGQMAAVGGGLDNSATGLAATIAGGFGNTASNSGATVPGGLVNVAAGIASFAAGDGAQATHDRSFVWADDRRANFGTTGPNQFLINADGGVGIGTDAPTTALSVAGTVTAEAFEGALDWAWLTGQPDIVAGSGLAGGGTLDQTRTLALDDSAIAACTGTGDKILWDPITQRLICGTDGGNVYTDGDGLTLAGGEFSLAPGGVDLNHLGFDPATQAELDGHKSSGDHDGQYLLRSASTEEFTGDLFWAHSDVWTDGQLYVRDNIIADGAVSATGNGHFQGDLLSVGTRDSTTVRVYMGDESLRMSIHPTTGDALFYVSADTWVNGDLVATGDAIRVNSQGPEQDSYLYFFNSGNNLGEYLKWAEGSLESFVLSDGLIVHGALTESSSIKAKANIETLEGALDDVTQLRGVSYDWKPDSGGEGRDLGLIAEEVAEVVPEAVTFDENGDPIGLRYGHMVGLLVEAVKEQQLLIEEQQAVNDALEARLSAIEAQLGIVPAP